MPYPLNVLAPPTPRVACLECGRCCTYVAVGVNAPKTVRYASSGVSSFGHIAMELLQRSAKIEMLHVPYKGGPAGMTALAAGEVDVGSGAIPPAIPPLIPDE